MNKSTRLSLIRRLAIARGLVSSVAGLMAASHAEIREETNLATNHGQNVATLTEDDESDTLADAPEVIRKVFDNGLTHEGSAILSPQERAELAQDLAAAQLAKRLPFAIVLRPNSEQDLNDYSALSSFAQ